MLISREANVSSPALRTRHRHAESDERGKKSASTNEYQLGLLHLSADCIRQRQREESASPDYILITWNLVWMNTACYTTEYRQCLSPKGQLYLKADSEGKPDLTFNHYFRRSLVSSRHIYILHVYTYPHILYYVTFSPIPSTSPSLSLSRHCTLEAATACLLALRVRIFTLTWLTH